MGTLIQDLRYGLRMLAKNPGFTIVAVMTLALGIGANATIFSYVNALLLHPPDGVVAPDGLLALWNRLPEGRYVQHSYPDYVYYRDHTQAFSGLLAYSSDPTNVSWSTAGQTHLIYGQLVSGNFFTVLGVRSALGRVFVPEEDRTPGRAAVVVLSHAFWEQHLGSDPAVVGKTLTLNGHSYTVVGVAPASFRGLETGLVPDFWAPIIMQHEIAPGNDLLANRNAYWVFLVGRVKPGVTPGQAQAEMSVLTRQLTQAYPRGDKAWDAAISSIVGVAPEFREFVVPFTALLMGVVGLVLLIACANAANLLLAQASGRVREMAIRSALGAERSRLIRQVLTESILLSLAAGGVGFLLAIWSSPLLLRLKPAMLSFITLDLQPDWRVIGFTLFASLLTGFVFGLVPALRSSKVDVVSRLKGESHGGFAKRSLRGALVVIQVAVCLVLLTSAGLCLRSLLNAQSIDPGFQIDNRLVVSLNVQILGYSEDRGRTFYQQLLDRVRAVPGVRSASLANYLPLGFTRVGVAVAIDGHQPPPGSPGIPVGLAAIAPEYFQTMGIPLLRGRDFGPQDSSEGPGVVIINEAMARRFWPGQDPIGRQVTFGVGSRPSFEIVGVVRTGKYHSLRETPEPFMYRPIAQFYSYRTTLIVRTANDPGPMLATAEREIHQLDPNLPVIGAETMRDYMKLPLFPARATGMLLGAFGLLALALAVTGLYGVVAYVVSQRTREIGIRMALGANRAEVLNMVLRQGLVLALAGVTLGVIMSLAVTHVLSKLLYGIHSTDPATYVAVSLVLMSVASLASYVPARRATKVDPMVALRYE